jgi:hypothetical protein
MKHLNLISLLLLLLLPAGAKAQFAWYGANGVAQVETGLGNGTGTDVGKWFIIDDSGDGGKSKIVWDVETEVIDDNFVQQCGGISGTAVLDQGELDYLPSIGVGFNVAGLDDLNKPLLADATAWEGIAISYSCDVAAAIVLGLGDDVDSSIGYANPSYDLPSAPSGNFIRIPWSSFKQPAWYMNQIEISDAVAALATVKFVIQNASGSYHFSINAIGSYNMPETPASSTTCKLAITASGSGSVSYDGITVRNQTSNFTVEKGTNPKLTFTPDEGYRVKSVTVGGVDVTSGVLDNSYTINDIQENTTVAVEFEAKPLTNTYTLTISATGNGSVSFNGATIRNKTSTFEVDEGTDAKITFTPDAGYMVASVMEGEYDVTGLMSEDSYTISNIHANKTIEVEFDESDMEKCATPTITFEKGKLKFSCDTEGVKYAYEITSVDAKKGFTNGEVNMRGKYRVTVYAMKDGYQNSDEAALDFTLGASGEVCDTNQDGVVDVADIATIIDKMASSARRDK